MFINFFQHFIFHYAAFIVKMSILQIKPLPDVRLGFVAGFICTSRAFLCDTLFNNIFSCNLSYNLNAVMWDSF